VIIHDSQPATTRPKSRARERPRGDREARPELDIQVGELFTDGFAHV
jgi:hypothetical protein